MNAVEFLKEERRMCESFEQGCLKCLLRDTRCRAIPGETDEGIEKEVAIVEKWSKEHPMKTRQSVFLEQYPETVLDEGGVVPICPLTLSKAHRNSSGRCKNPKKLCIDCRSEFWMQEVDSV